MVENDVPYFESRAAEELRAAERATSPEAERAHRELHRRFSRMALQHAVPVPTVIPFDSAQA